MLILFLLVALVEYTISQGTCQCSLSNTRCSITNDNCDKHPTLYVPACTKHDTSCTCICGAILPNNDHINNNDDYYNLRNFLHTAIDLTFDKIDITTSAYNPVVRRNGLYKEITINNEIPLSDDDTLELVITTLNPTSSTDWNKLKPVAWKVVVFNSQRPTALIQYKDSYKISVPQISSKNIVIPSTIKDCNINDQFSLEGDKTNYLWKKVGTDAKDMVQATNNIPNNKFNMAFIINDKVATLKESVSYKDYAQFSPTPKLYFTITSDYQESEIIKSVISSQTFLLDLINYTEDITATLSISPQGAKVVTFSDGNKYIPCSLTL